MSYKFVSAIFFYEQNAKIDDIHVQSEFYLHNHITQQFFPLKIKYKTNPKASYDIISSTFWICYVHNYYVEIF